MCLSSRHQNETPIWYHYWSKRCGRRIIDPRGEHNTVILPDGHSIKSTPNDLW